MRIRCLCNTLLCRTVVLFVCCLTTLPGVSTAGERGKFFLASAMSGDLALSVNSVEKRNSFFNAFGDSTRP